MLGSGSVGKFYFLSLLVNQLAPWIRCVTTKCTGLMKPWSNLGLGQGARSLSVFLQLRKIFCR